MRTHHTNEKVTSMVRRVRAQNPKAGTIQLYARAILIDETVLGLSVHQFHGKYALPVMRENIKLAKTNGKARRKTAKKSRQLSHR
jgi:hypothetical protein